MDLFSPTLPEEIKDPAEVAQFFANLAAWFREHAFDEIDAEFVKFFENAGADK